MNFWEYLSVNLRLAYWMCAEKQLRNFLLLMCESLEQ
jgi:hypothetical protein